MIIQHTKARERDVENCAMSPVVVQNRNNFYSLQRAAIRLNMTYNVTYNMTSRQCHIPSQVLATYCEPAFRLPKNTVTQKDSTSECKALWGEPEEAQSLTILAYTAQAFLFVSGV